jgi:ribose 5-phosphate isomerase B
MKIAIGNDHAGFELKNKIIEKYGTNFEFIDCGTNSTESANYPLYSQKVCKKSLNREVDFGILICGTGIGMSISANRNKGIRAGLCHHSQEAMLTRQHNDANILVLGARMIGVDVAFQCFETFIETEFLSGKHLKRIELIENIIE